MNNLDLRLQLVAAGLDLLPPRMKRSLLEDNEFVTRWGIPTTTGVLLGKNGPSFERHELYDAIRAAIAEPGSMVPISDRDNVEWNVSACQEAEQMSFRLSGNGKRFSLSDHSALAKDKDIRSAWLAKAAREFNLENDIVQMWRSRMGVAPLDDDEFAELVYELELTPTSVHESLRTSMARGSADISTLVPNERRYYERLVGVLGTVADVHGYIDGGSAALIGRLQEWKSVAGFLFSLLTCSAGAISAVIRIERLSTEELIRVYEWLAGHGDPISQIAAIEVALANLDAHPELEPFVERMVEGIIADDPENDGGYFALLSAMIVLVASEFARRRILADSPPFYRRQAAIAQASLIVRAINSSPVDPVSVAQWAATGAFGHIFFLQGLVDLRLEPRWLPDFVGADQLRAEFIGRISNAARLNDAKIPSGSLRRLLLGQDSTLAGAAPWPFPMLPGPLEGAIEPKQPIPSDVLEDITRALEAEQIEPNSFAGLVNTALIFEVPAGQSGLAAAALRRIRYSIENAGDERSIFALIAGLAVVAAITRGTELADTLRILVRVMRRRKRLAASPEDELRIAAIAAASHEELEDWARFVGDWLTEIAFEVSGREAAQRFLPKLRRLVQIAPALARHCAAADAALSCFGRQ